MNTFATYLNLTEAKPWLTGQAFVCSRHGGGNQNRRFSMTPSHLSSPWPFRNALVVLVISLGGYYLVLPYGRWAAVGYIAALVVLASTIRSFVVGAKFDLPAASTGRWWLVLGRMVHTVLETGETDGK